MDPPAAAGAPSRKRGRLARVSRFAEAQDAAFRRINDSISFDWRLGPYDVEQSKAHVRMLAAREIIAAADGEELLAALDKVDAELSDGSFQIAERDEDIHMAIERRVTELAGPVGGRMHTGRSRNDQVATDMALFVRAHAAHTAQAIGELAAVLLRAP